MPYELRALSRQFYRGGSAICALDRVTLRVDAGEYVAVVGPSGCGKTTLLHILGAIDPEYSGQLLLDDRDLATLNATERAALRLAKIGFVFQTFQLLDALTVQENIALPLWRLRGNRRTAEARAGELAEELGIGHRLKQRPHQLSVGEMQRAAVARALACDPMVILADEPTASLDADHGRHIISVLKDIARGGRMVLVATHDSAVIASASRVLKLDRGNLVHDTASPARDHSDPQGESGGAMH